MPTRKDSPSEPFGLTLCVATRGRVSFLRDRIPLWSEASFDDVVIVDNSVEAGDRAETEALCGRYGAKYLPLRPRLRDQRSRAWNAGIAAARTSWILIQGDDDEIICRWNKEEAERISKGVDYLLPIPGTEVLSLERGKLPFLFRRSFALEVHGFPDFLAGGEDIAMMRKFERAGRLGRYEAGKLWVSVRVPSRRFIPHPISVVRNLFWYQVNLAIVLLIVPRPKRFILGLFRDSRRFLIESQRERGGVLLGFAGLAAIGAGLLVSPVQLLRHWREVSEIRGVR